MNVSSLSHSIYYQNENNTNNREKELQNDISSDTNNLRSIYVDPDAISDLTLKAAHTSEILTQKVKDLQQDTRALKDVNFEKESKSFDKSNVESLSGSLKSSQASFISSKKVSELLG